MIRPLIIGMCFGSGLWLVARGLFPSPISLSARLARFSEVEENRLTDQTALRSLWGRFAVWLLRSVRGDVVYDVEADVAVAGQDFETHSTDKLNVGLLGAGLLSLFFFMFGVARSPYVIAVILVVGFAIFYHVPDFDLKRKAAARRREFNEVLTAFVSLVAVSISGGGGVNSAMTDATSLGGGWCFEALRRALEDSSLHGESPWAGFDRLGRKLNLVPLIELAGALSLAGMSGARVTETLRARAESSRDRELSEELTEAEKKSESMTIPVATMLLGWMGFMGYPAVIGLIGV